MQLNRMLPITLFTLVTLATIPRANAEACSEHSLKGSYGYTVTGNIVQNTGPFLAGPFVAVGRIVFDGNHGVSTVRSLNDDGVVLQNDSGTGTYKVNPDCTGSFNITVGPPGNQFELKLDIVLDGGDQVRGVVTTPDVVLAFDATKQLPIFY
jgi:hypothetical protein